MEGLIINWNIQRTLANNIIDLAYVAGLFDGEGCVSIDKASHQGKSTPRFQLHTTIHLREGNVLQELQTVFGGSLKPNKPRNSKHAPTWRWRLTSSGAARFLVAIYPYLKLKKSQAFFGVHFQNNMIKKGGERTTIEALIQEDHYWLIRDLNRKGVVKWKVL